MDEKSPQIRLAQPRGTVLTNMAVAALIIAALYFGREIFVPVALAVLLSFVLAPFVMRLHSWRIPRTISVLVVVFIGFITQLLDRLGQVRAGASGRCLCARAHL